MMTGREYSISVSRMYVYSTGADVKYCPPTLKYAADVRIVCGDVQTHTRKQLTRLKLTLTYVVQDFALIRA